MCHDLSEFSTKACLTTLTVFVVRSAFPGNTRGKTCGRWRGITSHSINRQLHLSRVTENDRKRIMCLQTEYEAYAEITPAAHGHSSKRSPMDEHKGYRAILSSVVTKGINYE